MSENLFDLLEDCTDSDDDASFVVLRSSSPSVLDVDDEERIISEGSMEKSLHLNNNLLEVSNTNENQSVQQLQEYGSDIAEVTNSSQYSSIDISSEEIFQKLNYLFVENASLQDALNENNMRVKKQYKEFITWQKKVMDIHPLLHRAKYDTLKGNIDTNVATFLNMSEKLSNLLEDSPASDDDESFVILSSSPPSVLDIDEERIISEVVESPHVNNNLLEVNETMGNESVQQLEEEYGSDIAEVTNSSQHGSIEIASEEILQKLNYLFEENASLKDSLNENNMRMKKQYNELVTWQKEVMDVHQLHRAKFDTLKSYVDTLKSENCKLQMALQKDMLKSFEKKEESSSFSGEQQLKAKIIDLEEEIEIFKRELEKERKLNRDNVKNYYVTDSRLPENESNRKLQEEHLVNNCNAMFGNTSSSCALLQNDLSKCVSRNDLESWVTETRNISGSYANEIHEKNEMIDTLKDEIKTLIVSIESKISEKDTVISDLQVQLKTAEDYKTSLSNHMQEELDTLRAMSIAKSNEKSAIISNLEVTLNGLQENVDDKTNQICELQKKAKEDETKISSLEIQKTDLHNANLKLQETVKMLQAKMSSMENNLIKSRNDEITTLTNTIEELETTVVLLTETSNVYRSDFEAEHSQKEVIRSERDQLTSDLNYMQTRNEQLLQQIQKLQGNTRASTSSSTSTPGAPPTFQCPTCFGTFYDYEALEKHVNRCIEIDSLF